MAAVFLVGAVAVATLEPPDMPLGALLLALDHDLSAAIEDGMQARLSFWMWDDVVLPVLLRPAWLLPAAIGLVLTGVSLTLSTRQRSQRTHGRRF